MADLPTARDHAVPSDSLGRYRLLGVLGQGSRGTFHLGVARSLGAFKKLVVVKELRPELARDPRSIEAFLVEAELAARLNHPNVVQILEADSDAGRPFLALEFLDGQTFAEAWRRNLESGGISLAVQVKILCEALSGLHHAHQLCGYDGRELNVVHGDVRPESLFVTYDGQVKLMNFRAARPFRETGSAGGFEGRLDYAAPEQVRGRAGDRRTDVFAVGVMLWEVLAGRRFTEGPTTPAAIKARLFGLEPRLAQAVPNAPHGLANICNRAMAVDPADRFSTAEDFRDALLAFLRASGDVADAPAIGAQVRALFESERGAMHRIIEAALSADEPLEPSAEPSPDAVTPVQRDAATVASVPPLTRAVEPDGDESEELPVFRSRRPAFVAALVATALAAAGGFWFGMDADATEPHGAAASGSPVVAAPSSVVSAAPSAAEPIAVEVPAAEPLASVAPPATAVPEPRAAAPGPSGVAASPPVPSAAEQKPRSRRRSGAEAEQEVEAEAEQEAKPPVSPDNPYE